MKLTSKLHLILLTCILLAGLAVRVYALDKNPYGFFCDEAGIGYNAYTILTTGKDEYGVPFPVFFESFGEYKGPVAIYATVPFIALFGLNEFSVRLQSAVFGVLTILLVYLVTKQLFTRNIALLSAAITATMPWLIHYNRTGFELNSYTALFLLTVYLLLKATKHKKFVIPAAITFCITLYTYYSAKLLVPLFLVGFLIIYGKKLLTHKKETLIATGLVALLSIPFIISFINGEGTARFNEVSIFTDKSSLSEILLLMVSNYFYMLSPTFFMTGDPTINVRHFAGGLLPLLLITVPFFYLGIYTVLTTLKEKRSQLLLFWLLLYPIAAAVVAEPPFTSRTIIGAPLIAILIALGIAALVSSMQKQIYKKITLSILGAAITLNFLFFAHFYFIQYPLYSAGFWGWQSGPREIVQYFTSQEKNYDELYMVGEFNAAYIFFNFYAPSGCNKCELGEPLANLDPTKKQLFAVTPAYIETHPQIAFSIKKEIYYPNGDVAFVIGEIKE